MSLPSSVDPQTIQEVLDGRWAHVRKDARENLDDPDFLPVYGENVQEARERVTRSRASWTLSPYTGRKSGSSRLSRASLRTCAHRPSRTSWMAFGSTEAGRLVVTCPPC